MCQHGTDWLALLTQAQESIAALWIWRHLLTTYKTQTHTALITLLMVVLSSLTLKQYWCLATASLSGDLSSLFMHRKSTIMLLLVGIVLGVS